MERTLFDEEHELFRDSFRRFVADEITPHLERWERDGIADRSLFSKAGSHGFLGMAIPEEHGGGGVDDFRYNQVIIEEVQAAGAGGAGLGITLHNDICLPYFLTLTTDEQKQRWLPGIASGELITAIAMTEPGTGSDLQALRTTAKKDGNHYVINGSKTYITNGQNADLILVCCKTDTDVQPAWKGVSIVLVEATREGFKRGRNLDKVGLDAADTSELFFEDVRVPITNCLGEEGKGFIYLMTELPQERLGIAISAQTAAQRAFDMTVEFCRDRKAFGQSVLDFQNTRFVLADLKAKLQVGWAHIDWALSRHIKHELTPVEASGAKLWHTELQGEVVDKCLQLHGGAGFMNEYPIAKQWRGARVTRIFGGTSEIMKELIGRSL